MYKALVSEASLLLNKSVENIRKMARRKKLKSQKIDGRIYILLDDVYAGKAKTLKTAGIKQAQDTSKVIADMRQEIERLKKENHSLILSVQKLTALLKKN